MSNAKFSLNEIFGDSLNLTLDGEDDYVEEIVEEVASEPKLVKVHKDGIEITDKELMEKVKKKNLSASMVSSFFQCPADWLMNSFILPLIDHEEPIHFVRGHIFHDTMERFFALNKEERSPLALSQLTMQVIREDYKESLNDKETMKWVKEALHGYIEAGFEYKDVEIAQIKKQPWKDPEPAVELFVRGKLGNTTREVVGFVDRIDQLPDGSLQIVDYKTGKKIYPFSPDKPISQNNDFGYWRQQLAYGMLLEQDGYDIGGAKLEFPIAKGEVVVDMKDENLRRQVEKDFEAVDAALNEAIENNFFPFNGHFFCKWCGMLSPDYPLPRFGKLNVSWEEVSQYVELLDQ